MSMKPMWMVRAGEGGFLAEDFVSKGAVAVGWGELGDLGDVGDRDELERMMRESYPEFRKMQMAMSLGQIARVRLEIKADHNVLTYNPQTRTYHVGRVTGDYAYEIGLMGTEDNPYYHYRPVEWLGTVSRDDLSTATRNQLGAIMTLFLLTDDAASEIEQRLSGAPRPEEAVEHTAVKDELELLREETMSKAFEFIKDRILLLSWEEMQELAAGVLRAMGFRTRVSPAGSDGGRDIIASHDPLGLERPRVIVEVKHRPKDSVGAAQIRSFLGGLREGDRGLYLSTGGFTKEARYEADRSNMPLTLLSLDDLTRLLLDHYSELDTDTRALVPLVRLYWPAS